MVQYFDDVDHTSADAFELVFDVAADDAVFVGVEIGCAEVEIVYYLLVYFSTILIFFYFVLQELLVGRGGLRIKFFQIV